MYCALATDVDVLRAGVASALEALESAVCHAVRLRAGAPPNESLDEIGACLHRAGRSAMTVGLAEISRSAVEVEEALEQLQHCQRPLTDEEQSLLEEALGLLTALVLNVNVRTGLYTVADGLQCLERLRATCVG
jgi:HPt (histidine-containing phosphotransfer) domain-containing protein